MDVSFFLRDRIAFTRQFFINASLPFLEKKRKIKVGEDPFIPVYSEDGEPPFLDEWIEADESIQILGYSCISMLSAALHLCLKTWEAELRAPIGNSFRSAFKKGWFNGYKAYFADRFGIDFEASSTNLSILEEIVLARNRIQHPDDILTVKTSYLPTDIKKLPFVFFVNETEFGLLSDVEETERLWLFPPSVHITEEKFMVAATEVEKFGNWLEIEISDKIYS